MKKIFGIILILCIFANLVSCGQKVNVVANNESVTTETTTTEAIRETVKETEIITETETEAVIEIVGELEYNAIETLENVETIESEEKKIVDSNKVEMKIKDYGIIELELDPTAAPLTVANFKKLVNEGFYTNLTFHRIISGFMIQGGDPRGDGTGGSKDTIKGEFANNGIDNPLNHTRGVISMARSVNPNSASSQFFIMHEDAPHLDGSYAAFGKVTSGMEVVDDICNKVPVQDDNGTVLKSDQPVIEYIKLVE